MNNKQKESLAKFVYDAGKLCFGGFVLAAALNGGPYWVIGIGVAITFGCVLFAVWLERD